jgi:SAM-dependent methyltransferase
MTLVELPRLIVETPGRPEWGDAAVFMRDLTAEIAMTADAWTPERAAQMASLFDSLASAWPERDMPERHDALRDALARGGPFPKGWCLEVGAGTGNITGDLRATFHDVVSIDFSREMLSLASLKGHQVQADASCLPVRAGSATVIALINMFLFPAEVARVLVDDGVLLWESTNGDATPIYLPPADVLNALPGIWHGVSAQAGWGTWLTARRKSASTSVTDAKSPQPS